MSYEDMEREAYTRGDTFLAEVLGQLLDKDEEIAETQKCADAEKEELDKTIEELQDRVAELESACDKAYTLVETAARVSDLKAILDALTVKE